MSLVRIVLIITVVVFGVATTLVAAEADGRLKECLAILNMRGDLHEADISSDYDPMFFHIDTMARDRGERVFYGSPKFFLFRPGHMGGQLSFTLYCARVQDRPFYGGRFDFVFGELQRQHVDVVLERLQLGEYLLDEEAKPAFRLIKGGDLKVSITVPPLTESIPIRATLPGGGAFFLKDISFSGQAKRKVRRLVSTNGGVGAGGGVGGGTGGGAGGAADAVGAMISKATGGGTATRPAPSAPRPASVRPAQPQRSRPVAKQPSGAQYGSTTSGSGGTGDSALVEKLKKAIVTYDGLLLKIEGHLSRAERKKSGHPKFLEALRTDVTALETLKKELESLTKNPSGYDW